MGRLVWTESVYGWQSDRYTIELAAPQLWVLTRGPKRGEDTIGTWSVIGTAGSLRELKAAAAELERRRDRHRVLLIHLAIVVTLSGLAVAAAALEWAVLIPTVIAVVALSLRALGMWIESVTGCAWSVLSQHYQ